MSSTDPALTRPVVVTLGPMTEHDLLEVVEIEECSGLSRWGWSAYYAELQGANGAFMVVARVVKPLEQLRTYDLAGYIIGRLSAEEIHINNVAVRAEYRRSGIGKQLLWQLLELGREAGAEVAFLEVRSANLVAQALYERCGFRPVGRRRNYYTDPVEDALIMRAELLR